MNRLFRVLWWLILSVPGLVAYRVLTKPPGMLLDLFRSMGLVSPGSESGRLTEQIVKSLDLATESSQAAGAENSVNEAVLWLVIAVVLGVTAYTRLNLRHSWLTALSRLQFSRTWRRHSWLHAAKVLFLGAVLANLTSFFSALSAQRLFVFGIAPVLGALLAIAQSWASRWAFEPLRSLQKGRQ